VTGEELAEAERRTQHADEAGRGILVAEHRRELGRCGLPEREQQPERLVGIGRGRERRQQVGRVEHREPRAGAAELGESEPGQFGQRCLVA
jgi:hypothetical protein